MSDFSHISRFALESLLVGELPSEDADRLDAHLSRCPHCTRIFQEMQKQMSAFSALADHPAILLGIQDRLGEIGPLPPVGGAGVSGLLQNIVNSWKIVVGTLASVVLVVGSAVLIPEEDEQEFKAVLPPVFERSTSSQQKHANSVKRVLEPIEVAAVISHQKHLRTEGPVLKPVHVVAQHLDDLVEARPQKAPEASNEKTERDFGTLREMRLRVLEIDMGRQPPDPGRSIQIGFKGRSSLAVPLFPGMGPYCIYEIGAMFEIGPGDLQLSLSHGRALVNYQAENLFYSESGIHLSWLYRLRFQNGFDVAIGPELGLLYQTQESNKIKRGAVAGQIGGRMELGMEWKYFRFFVAGSLGDRIFDRNGSVDQHLAAGVGVGLELRPQIEF